MLKLINDNVNSSHGANRVCQKNPIKTDLCATEN